MTKTPTEDAINALSFYWRGERGRFSHAHAKAVCDEIARLRAVNMANDANLSETERQLDACQRELRKARAEIYALKEDMK